MTSKLIKEQEQDSNLDKKLTKQQNDIKEDEERLITKMLGLKEIIISFENLRKYELIDRRNRIKILEEILQMPEITMNDIQDLKQQRQELISDIEKLENKLKNCLTISSELQIYLLCKLQKQEKIPKKI